MIDLLAQNYNRYSVSIVLYTHIGFQSVILQVIWFLLIERLNFILDFNDSGRD
jgi:hypothetical protein